MMLIDTQLLYPEIKLVRRPPANLIQADQALFEKASHPTLAPTHLYHYRHVNVTPEGVVFRGLSIEKRFLIYPDHKRIYNTLHVASNRVKRRRIKLPANENYLLFFDYWSNAIFHWMCDALPRLEAVKTLAKDCVLLLPEHYQYPYIHETLRAFSCKAIYKFPVDAFLDCPELYVPKQITTSGEINPTNFLALRKTLLDYFKPEMSTIEYSPNIYISRSEAKYRKVLNEPDLITLLDKYDFKVIHFEKLSVKEQVETAFYAKNMISLHGANLTNATFMQPGGNVMELRKNGDTENNYYYSLTDSIGCNYYYLNCAYRDTRPGNFFDVEVDLEKFEEVLEQMLGR